MKTKLSILLILILALSAFGGASLAQSGDTLNILLWQAASHLNPYLANGGKELQTASLVLEPLARYDDNGNMLPYLVTDIPTVANGGVSADLTSITWQLRDDIVWSDGSPVTAADVVFSGEFCLNPDTGCTSLDNFANVESIEALDELTVRVNFDVVKPFPYGPFVGYNSPIIQKAQFESCMGAGALECQESFRPIGTGPFMVEEFRTNDVTTYLANPNYRVEGQPSFPRAVIKGGGDAESAARAVLETGEADYAWNLQISPAVLNAMEAAGQGTVVVAFGTLVERLLMNHTNPDPALGENRSVWMADGSNGHPFLQVEPVWQAMSMAIDREVIAGQLYGAAGNATCNILPAPQIYASPNNSCDQDIDAANAMLDEAGIVDSDGDGVREYQGIPLRVSYQTSTNAVRQNTQALIKQWWSEIGIETELRNIDASVFFGGDIASPDTYSKFYTDIQMYTNGLIGTDPENYMGGWRSDQITHPDNSWNGNNVVRWHNEDYDALLDELAKTGVIEERAALVIQMNDMLVQNGVIFPLVHRGNASAHHNSVSGIAMNAWDSEFWNIAEWTRA